MSRERCYQGRILRKLPEIKEQKLGKRTWQVKGSALCKDTGRGEVWSVGSNIRCGRLQDTTLREKKGCRRGAGNKVREIDWRAGEPDC